MIHMTIDGKNTVANVMTNDIDEQSIEQIRKILSNSACANTVAIMPDVHFGKGIVIGFTAKMNDKVVPSWIGVDINCGVLFKKIKTTDLKKFDAKVKKLVPTGANTHKEAVFNIKDDFDWDKLNKMSVDFSKKYKDKFGVYVTPVIYNYKWFTDMCDRVGMSVDRAEKSIGTMGGNNHFIAIERSNETGINYLVIHTGSRNLGKRVCDYHNDRINTDVYSPEKFEKLKSAILADDTNKKERGELLKQAKKDSTIETKEYLEGKDALNYLFDMMFAQEYANTNRRVIAEKLSAGLELDDTETQTCHNFIDFEDWIIRKGAVRSYEGEQFIVPLNMRDGSLLCVGKSNPEWNNSGPHGAGRKFSRNKAKATLDLDHFKETMKGIYTTCVGKDTLDEAPGAYKDRTFDRGDDKRYLYRDRSPYSCV